MEKNILKLHYDVLNTIELLNNNKEYFNIINYSNNFNEKEKCLNYITLILKDDLYFYYLNDEARKIVVKFIKLFNKKDLFELYYQRIKFCNYINNLINTSNNICNQKTNNNNIKSFLFINDKKMLNTFDVKNLKKIASIEKKFISFLLGDDSFNEDLKNEFLLPYMIINFINKFKQKINFSDIKKISELIYNIKDSDLLNLDGYLNVNYVNNLYTDIDIETFEFYRDVLNFFIYVKDNNFKIISENKDIICDSYNNSNTLVITKNDFDLLPSILNYLVSSEHFCFSFTNNDLERIYNIVNYCRFNMLKENEKKFMLCDIIIGKLNMLTMHNQQREENKENSLLYTKFVKALLELTAVNKKNIVKNFKDLSIILNNVQIYERNLINYLNDPDKMLNNEIFANKLYFNLLTDISIIYLLNNKINMFSKEQLILLKDLINVKQENYKLITKNNRNIIEFNGSYKKALIKISNYIDERCNNLEV